MGADGARIHTIQPGISASPEEGSQICGGRSHSPSPSGLAKSLNSTSHICQQTPPDPNRGNDGLDQDPPPIPSHRRSDILRLDSSGEGGQTTGRWKAEIFCAQLDESDQRSMGFENHTGLRAPVCVHSTHVPQPPPLLTSIRK